MYLCQATLSCLRHSTASSKSASSLAQCSIHLVWLTPLSRRACKEDKSIDYITGKVKNINIQSIKLYFFEKRMNSIIIYLLSLHEPHCKTCETEGGKKWSRRTWSVPYRKHTQEVPNSTLFLLPSSSQMIESCISMWKPGYHTLLNQQAYPSCAMQLT